MEYRNIEDVRNQLLAAGLLLDSVTKANGGVDVGGIYVESARSVRCDVSGEKKRKTGSYWLHELRLNDGIWITGAYWLDHGNSKGVIELRKTCAKCGGDMPLKATICPAAGCGSKKIKPREIPPEQIEAHKKRMAEARRLAEAEAERDAERAALWANAVWLRCREIVRPDEHEYLARKKLNSAHGTRVFESNDGIMLDGAENEDYEYLAQFHGALVVPMCDAKGRRRGLQFILSRDKHKALIARQERDKNFWPRAMLNPGLHCVIGGAMRGSGIVAEGFATAASLADESNLPVAVAFQANRLASVAEALWKAAKKRLNLLIAADDDWLQRCVSCKKITPVAAPACAHCGQPHGKENAGARYAQDAARIVSGAWFKPVFSVARPTDKKGPTDFNDLRCIEGPDAVRTQVEEKLADLGWHTAPGELRPSAGGGGSAHRGGGGGAAGGHQGAADGAPRKERRRAVAVMMLDDAVERFIPLDDGTGKHVFDTWTNKIVMREQMLAMLPAGMGSNDIKRHPVWIDRGAFYLDQVGFDPSGNDKTVKLNTWQGWPMVAKEGKCDLLLELLDYFCSGEPNARELSQWVLRWMAYPLQHPGAKMASAIIMHGPQGTGKSTVFQTLAKIYGEYSTVLNQRGLEDKFNSDWSDSKLFILAEEVVTRAEMWHIKNELKELVTGDWIRINPKNIAAYRQRNQLNIAYLSNENQPLPLENDDRRHCVIRTPPPVGENFYDEVNVQLENGGVEAFYHYLLHIDLGDFHPKKRPPMTDAKRDLILLSMPSEHRFVNEWVVGDTEWPVCPCLAGDLYSAYMRWCKNNGEQRPRPSNHFHGFVGRLPGWEKKKCRVYRDSSYLGDPVGKPMVIPPKDVLEAAGAAMPPGALATRWLTDSHVRFSDSLKGREERWAA